MGSLVGSGEPLRLDGHRHCVGYLHGMLDDGRERVPAGLEEATRLRGTVVVYDPDLVGLENLPRRGNKKRPRPRRTPTAGGAKCGLAHGGGIKMCQPAYDTDPNNQSKNCC